jgi:hypothetical protein
MPGADHGEPRHFRYGDPALQLVNTFLFTSYVVGIFNFFFIAGSFSDGMLGFCGVLGLGIAINNGVCRAPARPSKNIIFKRPMALVPLKPHPAFQRPAPGANPL